MQNHPFAGEQHLRHFSALLVQCTPVRLDACIQDLESLPGTEVHHSHPPSGRIIVVQESRSLEQQKDNLERIERLPSVLTAHLVYHYQDRDPDSRLSVNVEKEVE